MTTDYVSSNVHTSHARHIKNLSVILSAFQQAKWGHHDYTLSGVRTNNSITKIRPTHVLLTFLKVPHDRRFAIRASYNTVE